LYEEWGWGGYIGWNLYPDYLVFQDGRYIFHSLLKEEAAAQASPEAWQSFLEAHGVQAALMLNLDWRLPTTRVYPDGSSKEFRRPYYALYMPKNKWALVYWDDKALLFVRRGAAPPAWLKAHEYLYARPHDDDALRDALSRGEIPRPKLDAEFLRHSADVKRL